MIIIGIDPGSRVTGYGVIAVNGNHLRCLDYGSIAGKSEGPFPERLRKIHGELQSLLERYAPAGVVVENLFHAVNVRSALTLGHTRGVILLAAAQAGVPLYEYTPLEIKKAVVGYGRAEKIQIQMMVRRLLKLKETPYPHDAADALAAALCHAFRGKDLRARTPP